MSKLGSLADDGLRSMMDNRSHPINHGFPPATSNAKLMLMKNPNEHGFMRSNNGVIKKTFTDEPSVRPNLIAGR